MHLVDSLTVDAYRIWVTLFEAISGSGLALHRLLPARKTKSTALSARYGVRTDMPTSSDLAQEPLRRNNFDVIYPKTALFDPCLSPTINYLKKENTNLKKNHTFFKEPMNLKKFKIIKRLVQNDFFS